MATLSRGRCQRRAESQPLPPLGTNTWDFPLKEEVDSRSPAGLKLQRGSVLSVEQARVWGCLAAEAKRVTQNTS